MRLKSFVLTINDIDEITDVVSTVLRANGYTDISWSANAHYRNGKVKTYIFRHGNGKAVNSIYIAVSKTGVCRFCTTGNIEIWKEAFEKTKTI